MIIDYEIIEAAQPGYWELYRVVRRGDVESREMIDRRCSRRPLEAVVEVYKQPGGWANFF